MKVSGCVWLPAVVEKLAAKHHVRPREVEEVFRKSPQVRFRERGYVVGEHLYRAFGCTEAGRYLAVFFIYRGDRTALIVTARDMDEKERKLYDKSR